MAENIKVTFYGTAGSKPIPGMNRLKYGGHTSCVFVEKGDIQLVFDTGTGVGNLGSHLLSRAGGAEGFRRLPERQRTFHIFLTHYHPDHHEGFPTLRYLILKRQTLQLQVN